MLKPKTSVQNMRAMHYKRYTNIEVSNTVNVVYVGAYGDYWVFDKSTLYFVNIPKKDINKNTAKIISIQNVLNRFRYGDLEFSYNYPRKYKEFTEENPAEFYDATDFWEVIDVRENLKYYQQGITIEDLLKNNYQLQSSSIGKYQINQYYYNGSFDFMIRGDIEKAEVQYIKGLITPTTSFEIRTFDDSVKLDHDDLVVIDGRLYAIESVSVTQKRVPKKFNIYYATLTSIL